jgi:hypothetical protein
VCIDSKVIEITPDTKALGFKNLTYIGKLAIPLDEMESTGPGCEVFVKVGESPESCMFAVECDQLRRQLGMASTDGNICLKWLVVSVDYEALAMKSNSLWCRPLNLRMKKATSTYADSFGALPTLIMRVFDGHDLSSRKELLVDGMQLLKVLLFRKYVGAADTNGKNMMIDEEGRVLSVDETPASLEQLKKAETKGLVTAQAIHKDLLFMAKDALVSRPGEVGDFLVKLKQLALSPNITADGRMTRVHSKVPFDEGTVGMLLSHRDHDHGITGSKSALSVLAKRLNID